MADLAIEVDDVAKRFKLIHERNSTLKATIFRGMRRTTFEEFWALDGVSFEVPVGSTFALIGENGSGKSTMLKCLARIYRPDRGTIATTGKVSALLELGAGFHPELSGRENVYLNGSILGLSSRDVDDRFDEIVAFAGLERFIDSPVKNYSSGMFVRLGFSVAINVEPDVLLVDEVLAVGDEDFQRKCMEKFADLREKGRTVVVVSHGLEQIRNICDNAIWLDHGRVRHAGPAAEVVNRYLESVREGRTSTTREEQVAGLIGAVTVRDGDAAVASSVGLGDPLRIDVELSQPAMQSVVIELDVVRSDGMQIGGSRIDVDAGTPPGTTLSYTIEQPLLHPATYEIFLTVFDEHHQAILGEHPHAARFDVANPRGDNVRGLVGLGGDWARDDPT